MGTKEEPVVTTYQGLTVSARQWIDQNRPVALTLCVLLIFVVGMVSYIADRRDVPSHKQILAIENVSEGDLASDPEERSAQRDTSDQKSALITVHVVGAVNAPGVYAVSLNSRVIDAVQAAGGLSTNASSESVNMAQVLSDGAQVRIPTKEEAECDLGEQSYGVIGPDGTGASSAIQSVNGTTSTSLIDINTADSTLLETLPGIGPSTSAKIIAERTSNGPFRSLADLARVSGIGEKKIEALDGLAEVK